MLIRVNDYATLRDQSVAMFAQRSGAKAGDRPARRVARAVMNSKRVAQRRCLWCLVRGNPTQWIAEEYGSYLGAPGEVLPVEHAFARWVVARVLRQERAGRAAACGRRRSVA
eukprot:5430226-Pleurochrysis_carterae.AAC.7